VRSLVGSVAAVLLTASAGLCAEEEGLLDLSPAAAPQALFFSGLDVWHTGAFVHGGLLWSPQGLEREGFTLKLLVGAGQYRYRSGALGGLEITGTNSLAAIMPGWRFKAEAFEATVYAGIDVQDHQLTPDDPGSRLRGLRAGLRAGADIWYEPTPGVMMLAANVSISTIGPTYWTRIAAGWRAFDAVWLGPEAQALGGPDYQQWRIGVHATSLKTGALEWQAGVGFATDSDKRSGVYARLGVLTRR
jgi:hypothetical protein